jgi:hypothetical protein
MVNENQEGLIDQPLVVINVGLKDFAMNLELQGAEVVQVDWAPPAGGDSEMIDLLNKFL